MIDMSSWKSGVVDVLTGVDLDPRNVRLDLPVGAPQPDVIQDLFKNEKALDLVSAIVKVGYLTHEVPIVLKRSSGVVVVEGNRRVAALKAIQNPYVVPEYQHRISGLTSGLSAAQRKALRKIEVKIAPSEDAANQLIAALHTSNQRVAWSPARQAAFFQAQVDGGKSLSQMRLSYPTVDVEKFVLRSAILKKFQSVKYVNPDLNDFVRSRDFKMSTLARLYESKEFVELTGLKLDRAGRLKCAITKSEFATAAHIIVDGMYDGRITTRSIGRVTSPGYRALIEELRRAIAGGSTPAVGQNPGSASPTPPPSASSGTASQSSPATSTSSGSSSAGGKTTAHPSGARSRSIFLDVSQLSVPSTFPPAIHRIFAELSTLNIDRHPNAALDLLRTALEKAIKAYADALGVDIKKTNNQSGFVQLGHCLSWLEAHIRTNGPKAQLQVVVKIQNGRITGHVANKSHLDAINHNHFIFAEPDDVRNTWDSMQSLFGEVLFK